MIKKMSDGPEGLTILLPLPRIWPLSLFLGLWLAGWAKGEWQVAGQLLRALGGGAFSPGDLFLLVWLAGWTVGGAFALLALCMTLAGEEEIVCDGRTLSICWGVFGYGMRKKFPVQNVRALGRSRMGAIRAAMGGRSGPPLPPLPPGKKILPGLCYFLPGARPIPFGWKLTEAEAEQVLGRLRSRYPFPDPGTEGFGVDGNPGEVAK